MKTLLGETIVLDEEAFVLTQNDHPTVLGGIVGSAVTGVDDRTTDIILDAGNYNQTNIRKTSRRVKIQNETVSRSDKFLHPYLTEVAIQRATELILEIAGGEYYENVDWYPQVHPTKKLILTYARVKLLSGLDLAVERIKDILTKIEYRILSETSESITLEVPFFRTDVEVEDDIVSDVLRINDYANIPLAQVNAAPPVDITPKIYIFEDRLRDICVNLGLHEHITDPLVPADEHQPNQVKLENSQSQLKNALRTNIHDGLKAVAQVYAKHQIENAELFEIGKVYWRIGKSDDYSDYTEPRVTQIYIKKAGANHIENSTETRSVLAGILSAIGITDYKLVKANYGKVAIVAEDKNIGYMAWDQITLLNEPLMPLAKTGTRVVTEYSVVRTDDISILVPLDKNLGDVAETIKVMSEKISLVEIIPQNYNGGDMKFKVVLARISHGLSDFAPVRENILLALKDKLNVTTK
jgi:phenylalanyl-tRNA synthetase beta chain